MFDGLEAIVEEHVGEDKFRSEQGIKELEESGDNQSRGENKALLMLKTTN
jgi:hypothetical protein